jgi:hypothetical protein
VARTYIHQPIRIYCTNDEKFTASEFQVRDLVHKIGAKAIETALNERKKGATKGPA